MSNDPTNNPPPSAPQANVTLNAGADGNMGVGGILGRVWNSTAMGIIAAVFVLQMWWQHGEQQINRMAFESNVQRLQDQADRHTGEIKGAVDKNTEVMRDFTSELRIARQRGDHPAVGAKPPELKPIPPGQ